MGIENRWLRRQNGLYTFFPPPSPIFSISTYWEVEFCYFFLLSKQKHANDQHTNHITKLPESFTIGKVTISPFPTLGYKISCADL